MRLDEMASKADPCSFRFHVPEPGIRIVTSSPTPEDRTYDGIIVPHNSPVYDSPKKPKPKIEGKFAAMLEIYFGKLTPTEFYTYAAMIMLGGWKEGMQVITNPQIQKKTNMSRSTITRAQSALKGKGFLKRETSAYKLGSLWTVNTEGKDIAAAAAGDMSELFPTDKIDLCAQSEPTKVDLCAQYEPPRKRSTKTNSKAPERERTRVREWGIGGEAPKVLGQERPLCGSVDSPRGEVVPPLVVNAKRKGKSEKRKAKDEAQSVVDSQSREGVALPCDLTDEDLLRVGMKAKGEAMS